LESFEEALSFERVVAEERALSHTYGGRSIFGWEGAPERRTA
jgi:hypothetical protein